MALTITDNRTLVDHADATSTWVATTGPNLFTSDPDPVEATGCLGMDVGTTTDDLYFPITSADLSDVLVYVWVLANGTMDIKDNGGIAIMLGDGTDYIGFHVAGSDVAGFRHGEGPVGWQCLVLDTTKLGTLAAEATARAGTVASLTTTTITRIGSMFKTLSKALGGSSNCFTDTIRYDSGSQGITMTAGTDADPGTFSDIATADRSTTSGTAYGILRELGAGLYGCQGSLTFGDTAGTAASLFRDKNSTVVFEDRNIGTSRYKFTVQGNATGETTFQLGTKVGTDNGVDGGTIEVPLGVGGELIASDPDLDFMLLYGATIKGFVNGVTFSSDATNGPNHEIFGNRFVNCGQIDAGEALYENNTFVDSIGQDGGAILLLTDEAGTAGLTFTTQGNPYDIGSVVIYSKNEFPTIDEDGEANGIEVATSGSLAGKRYYVLGRTNDTIYEYSSSVAWDLGSTVAYTSQSHSVTTEDNLPTGFAFNNDGTKLYMVGTQNADVHEYTVATAWDFSSTITATGNDSALVTVDDTTPQDVFWDDVGAHFYIVGTQNDKVYQYSCSTNFDMGSTLADTGKTLDYSTQSTVVSGGAFSADGFILTLLATGILYKYTLTTAFDVSTASFDDTTYSFEGSVGTSISGIAYGDSGKKLFVTRSLFDSMHEMHLNVKHGIEINPTGAGPFTYNLDNYTFEGFATEDGSIGNEAIFVNPATLSANITINVLNGGTTPSIHTVTGYTGTVTVNNAQPLIVNGLTEGGAVKVIANETAGTITLGDTILEGLADSTGTVQDLSFNYESAFNPSGLDVIVRARGSGVPTAAIADDNGVFVDETSNANSSTVNDMNLLPATPVANQDRFIFGHAEQFDSLKLDVSTAGTGGFTITWQYWNGAWVNLSGVTDGTSNLSVADESIVSWTVPGDWATTTINSQGPYYYVRAAYTAGTVTVTPLGRKVKLNVTKYLPFVQERTIISTGLTVVASWIEDTIAQL